MKEEIKNFIITQCKKQNMEPIPSSIISERSRLGEVAEHKTSLELQIFKFR